METISYALDITDTTDSTSSVTGALQVAGGVGIEKNLFIKGGINSVNKGHIILSDGTASPGGIISGSDINHSIYLRKDYLGIANVMAFYEWGTIDFYTGGAIATQGKRLVISNNGLQVFGTISVNNVATANTSLVTLFQPNLVASGLTQIIHGVATSTGNAACYDFNYVSAGSTDNNIGLGFYGNNNVLRVYHSGAVNVTSTKSVGNITKTAVTLGTGALNLTGDMVIVASSKIIFGDDGVAGPTFTTRSAGTKIVLYPSLGASTIDYALGMANSTMWFSVEDTSRYFRWYGGTTLVMQLSGSGSLSITNTSTANSTPLLGLTPALATGYFTQFGLGVASSTNNTFETRFYYMGAGLATNYALLSFYGNATTGLKIVADGTVSIPVTTDSTSTTTGALQVSGGLAVAKSIYSGLSVNIVTTSATETFSISSTHTGQTTGLKMKNHAGVIWQIGMTGSTPSGVYAVGGASSFGIYNYATTNTPLSISVSDAVMINTTTDSTSVTTGALQIAGGLGINGNMYIGGGIYPQHTGGVIMSADVYNNFKFNTGAPASNTWNIMNSSGSPLFRVAHSGSIQVTNLAAATGYFNRLISAHKTAMASSETNIIILGQSDTAANAGYMGFTYMGAANASNCLNFGIHSTDNIMSMFPSGSVIINTVTESTSTTTGALQVAGGLAITKSLYMNSDIILGGNLKGDSKGRVYPSVPLPAPTTVAQTNVSIISNQAYGNGTYVTTQSSSPGDIPTWAWYKTINTKMEQFSSDNVYSATGAYNGTRTTVVSGITYAGEYIQIQYPHQVKLLTWEFYTRMNTGAPATLVIAASNDGVKWTLVFSQTTPITWLDYPYSTIFTLTNPDHYTHYRLICLTTGGYIYFDGRGQILTAARETILLPDTTDSISATTGALQVAGGIGLAKSLTIGFNSGNQIRLIRSDSTVGGSIAMSNVNLSRMLITSSSDMQISTGATSAYLYLTAGGTTCMYMRSSGVISSVPFSVTDTTDSTSATTGAFQVAGGVGIGKTLNAGISSTGIHVLQTTSSSDILRLHNLSNTGYAAIQMMTPSNTLFFGLGGSTSSAPYVNNAYLTAANSTNFILNTPISTLQILSTTIATSTTTGALQVAGGAGISKDLYVGGQIWVQGASNYFRLVSSGSNTYFQTGAALATGSTANLYFSGIYGTPIYAQLGTNGLVVNSTTDSTSTTSGALQVAGGVGIGRNLFLNNSVSVGAVTVGGVGDGTNYSVLNITGNSGRYWQLAHNQVANPVGGLTNSLNLGYNNGTIWITTLVMTPTAMTYMPNNLTVSRQARIGNTLNPTLITSQFGITALELVVTSGHTAGTALGINANSLTGGKNWWIFSTGGDAGEGQGRLILRNATDNNGDIVINPDMSVKFPTTISHAGYGCFNLITTASVAAGGTMWFQWAPPTSTYQTSKIYVNPGNSGAIYLVDPGMYLIHLTINVDSTNSGSFAVYLNDGYHSNWTRQMGDERQSATWNTYASFTMTFMYLCTAANTQIAFDVVNNTNATAWFSSGPAFGTHNISWSRLMIHKVG